MILKDDVKLEWKNLYMSYLCFLFLTKYISASFIFFLSVGGWFSTALFVVVVHDVFCINIVFVIWRVTHNISSPLAASHFVFVWCQAAVLYPCPPFPAICLQANHTVYTGRFVLGSSVIRVTVSTMWCKCMAVQDNLANCDFSRQAIGTHMGVTINT